jgi:hypothetical protein
MCGIFATARSYFQAATVCDEFAVSMSRLCNKTGGRVMKSVIIKRSVIVSGHKTSISLEDPFWKAEANQTFAPIGSKLRITDRRIESSSA